jgi:hypothetical protein
MKKWFSDNWPLLLVPLYPLYLIVGIMFFLSWLGRKIHPMHLRSCYICGHALGPKPQEKKLEQTAYRTNEQPEEPEWKPCKCDRSKEYWGVASS